MSVHDADIESQIVALAERMRERVGGREFLTLDEAAWELGIAPSSLRVVLGSRLRRAQPWAARLWAGSRPRGRRLTFRAREVAACAELGDFPLSDEEIAAVARRDQIGAGSRRRLPGRRRKGTQVGAETGVAAPASAGQRR